MDIICFHLVGPDQCMRQCSNWFKCWTIVVETIYWDTSPIDALDNNENVGVGLRQDAVSGIERSFVPIVVVVQSPVGIIKYISANLLAELEHRRNIRSAVRHTSL